MLDLEKITLNVREIALRAGAFLRNERSGFDRSKVEKKNAHDYVSYVDKESERRIVAQLRELLPEAGFIAEEGSGSLTTENYCWLVDPLDGTTNFIHNNAPYCVSIALRNKEELLYNPQIQISAESETKRSIFRKRDKTKRSKKESAQHSKSRNKSFVMTSVSAL